MIFDGEILKFLKIMDNFEVSFLFCFLVSLLGLYILFMLSLVFSLPFFFFF